MKVATAEQMRRIDAACVEKFAMPSLLLMENAGLQVAAAAARLVDPVKGKKIVVLCGRGNNGGDGFVAARHLANQGARVSVFLLGRSEEVAGDAAINLRIVRHMGMDFLECPGPGLPDSVTLACSQADLVIDGLLGTGSRGEPRGVLARVIEALDRSGARVLAIDIPSGLDPDTGAIPGVCVRATKTVALGLLKRGLVVYPGAAYAGEVEVVDLSIPRALLDSPEIGVETIDRDGVGELRLARPRDSHKGQFGHVGVVGGSVGLTGAVALASVAALRAGAGLVTLAVPESLHDLMEAKLTEVMTLPLRETRSRTIALAALEQVMRLQERVDVLAVGPGMGAGEGSRELVVALLRQARVPLVLDADALNALAGRAETLREAGVPVIVTPHPGEMARLLGVTVTEVQADRITLAARAAASWGTVVVLKGARSVVADPGGWVGVNMSGNPGMATAGAGDVLTGITAALLAQGLAPPRAAACGTYLHGLAGDCVAARRGEKGMTAGEIADAIPHVLRELGEY